MNKPVWIFLLAIITIASCKKEENQFDIDARLIEEYISNNNITDAVKHESGVYYLIDEVGDGSGVYPFTSSTVRVYYRGTLLDGTEFDGNFGDTPTNFKLFETIAGWQIGIPYFEKGSKGRLFIPSTYGYGSRDLGNIPPNSVLIFEFELINVFN